MKMPTITFVNRYATCIILLLLSFCANAQTIKKTNEVLLKHSEKATYFISYSFDGSDNFLNIKILNTNPWRVAAGDKLMLHDKNGNVNTFFAVADENAGDIGATLVNGKSMSGYKGVARYQLTKEQILGLAESKIVSLAIQMSDTVFTIALKPTIIASSAYNVIRVMRWDDRKPSSISRYWDLMISYARFSAPGIGNLNPVTNGFALSTTLGCQLSDEIPFCVETGLNASFVRAGESYGLPLSTPALKYPSCELLSFTIPTGIAYMMRPNDSKCGMSVSLALTHKINATWQYGDQNKDVFDMAGIKRYQLGICTGAKLYLNSFIIGFTYRHDIIQHLDMINTDEFQIGVGKAF